MMGWKRVSNEDELESYFNSVIPEIRKEARECGYAIGIHGSMRRDLDLIAVPWIDNHVSPDALATRIQGVAVPWLNKKITIFKWEKKPCGRVATSLHSEAWIEWADAEDGTGHIDLSVMGEGY